MQKTRVDLDKGKYSYSFFFFFLNFGQSASIISSWGLDKGK